MANPQLLTTRRNYNRWVANQTLEDFALRFTGKNARRWSSARVSNTALGAISFLALEAIGLQLLWSMASMRRFWRPWWCRPLSS